jgi:hypothetical protein
MQLRAHVKTTNFEFKLCQMYMNPCSAIDVLYQPGLSISNGTILQGISGPCGQLWRGIRVNQGASLLINASSVKDALFAIHVLGFSRLSLSNGSFENNFIGLNIKGENGSNISAPLIFAFSGNTFTTNGGLKALCPILTGYFSQFRPSTAASINTNVGYAGISATNAIFGLPADIAQDNSFSNLANGIVLINTSVPENAPIRRCRFSSIQPVSGYALSGNAIYIIDDDVPNTFHQDAAGTVMPNFTNCGTGVFARISALNSYFSSGGNTMTGVGTGYNLECRKGTLGRKPTNTIYPQSSKIYGNTITASVHGIKYYQANSYETWLDIAEPINTINTIGSNSVGILLESNAPYMNTSIHNIWMYLCEINYSGKSGIEAVNMTGIAADYCTITNVQGPLFSVNFRLVESKNSSLTNNFIWSSGSGGQDIGKVGMNVITGGNNNIFLNKFRDTWTGMRFTGYTPATVRCNRFIGQHSFAGLLYDPGAITGEQNQKANCWSGSTIQLPPVRARHLGTQLEIEASVYKVYPLLLLPNCYYHPQVVTTNPPNLASLWFQLQPLPAWQPCLQTTPPGLQDYDIKTIRNYANNNSAAGWWRNRYLAGRLKAFPDLLNTDSDEIENIEVTSYASYIENEPPGRFADLTHNIYKNLQFSVNIQQYLTIQQSNINNWIQDLYNMDPNGLDIENEWAITLNNIQQSIDEMQFHINVHNAGALNVLQELSVENSSMPSSEVFLQNEKTLNSIWLSSISNEIELSSTQKNSIALIAAQCPVEGGPAVHWARLWHRQLTGEDYITDDPCNSNEFNDSEERSQETVITPANWIAMPNPADDQLVILLSIDDTSMLPTVFVILDSYGRLVKEIECAPYTEQLEVETSLLDNGVYIIRKMSLGQPIESTKFVVLHK